MEQEPNGQGPYIFISYSRDDTAKVRAAVEEMRRRGYRVWNDTHIRPGEIWPDYIAAHIADCAVCVAFHSSASRDSQHCREEIHYALKHGKTVISVYLEDVKLREGLDMQLAPFQSVRYGGPEDLLEQLRKSPEFEKCGGDTVPLEKIGFIQRVRAGLRSLGNRLL